MVGANERLGIGEAAAVLAAVGLVALEIVVTYTRVPTDELYNVSVGGLAGGLGRAVVFLCFPAALLAIPVAVIAAERIGGSTAWVLAAIAVGLSAVAVVPGVVEQSDLDVRLVNAVPAIGVALAAALLVAAGLRTSFAFAPRRTWDPVRLAVALVLLAGAVPWLAAELGLSLEGVPVLGSIWQTGELRLHSGHSQPQPAVHSGHHHGMDGVLLALGALALSRMRVTRLRVVVDAYLALLLAYGLANAVQDWWLEQVVKRGWTGREIPNLLIPELSVGWATIVAAALVIGLGSVVASRTARPPNRQT